jgi:hypothetical protein
VKGILCGLFNAVVRFEIMQRRMVRYLMNNGLERTGKEATVA